MYLFCTPTTTCVVVQYNQSVNSLLPLAASSQTFNHAHPFVQPTNIDPPDFRGGFGPECPELSDNYTPLDIDVVHSTDLMDNPTEHGPSVYPTHSLNRAAVLIINNVKYINDVESFRTGADVDSHNLKNLFRKMGGCRVEFHKDLTSTVS